MAQQRAVKVLQVFSVAPPAETTGCPAPTSLPLTFFDILWLRFPPVKRLFFYEFPHQTSFFDSLLPRLKLSLSLTLQHYLPFAGNLVWPHDAPKPFIRYVAGDSLPLTIAESDADFNVLSGTDPCEAAEYHHLISHLTVSHEQASVSALQITLFPSSGFSIGITTHHAAFDGKTSTSFMKSWAYIFSNLESFSSPPPLPDHLIPFYDRSVIKDSEGIEEIYLKFLLDQGGPNNKSVMVWDFDHNIPAEATRSTFEFTPSHLQKLKQKAECKLKNKARLSTFSVTLGYVTACTVKAEQTENDTVAFSFSVDCRSRLEPPIPPSYFGNCIGGLVFGTEKEKLLADDGFVAAAEVISENLITVGNGLKGAETWPSILESLGKNNKVISTAGSPRFEVYSVDFGWGRPKKVEIISIDRTGAFSFAESKHGNGGIEIGLVLKKSQMEAFADHFTKGLESI
ncbi:hypothetical protein L6164_007555 [Bauhinia variegata]|uniref:Uncharacterized protein n=1 Tax=Bauhinia variegata TaxID=167791 RepID=A0ACB9PF23_BAUVA|nr:hypothetical protein L6164_007555 [Bauhinia variegata]